MSRGGRKSRKKSCFPSCFSGPSVWDSEELEFRRDGSPEKDHFLCRKKAVAEFAGGGGKDLPANSKEEKRKTKNPVQSIHHTPTLARTYTQQSQLCHVPTKLKSQTRSLAPLKRARAPIRVTPQPNRSTVPAPSLTQSTRHHDVVTGLLTLSSTLIIMLFLGRLSAILCICLWFYILCWIAPPLTAVRVTVTKIDGEDKVNVDLPEYKKKVVLTGLLERNK